MPTLPAYSEQATAAADASAPAGPAPGASARAHGLVGRPLGRQVAGRLRQVSREQAVARQAPEPYSPLPPMAPGAVQIALWQGRPTSWPRLRRTSPAGLAAPGADAAGCGYPGHRPGPGRRPSGRVGWSGGREGVPGSSTGYAVG